MSLLVEFLAIVQDWRCVFPQQRTFQRAVRQALGSLVCLGRRCLTRIIWTNGGQSRSWGGVFLHSRCQWEPQQLFQPILRRAPVVNQERALALVSLPLSCIDHPQPLPENRVDYLWLNNDKPRLVDGYDKNRVFYGCSDWHSAVHSVWCLVVIAKQFAQIPVAALIKDRLKDHLGKKNIEGEMEFLKNAKKFEIPYGYAWVLKLYAELKSWADPDSKTWTENMAPLAQEVSKKLVQYFKDLRIPSAADCIPIRRT